MKSNLYFISIWWLKRDRTVNFHIWTSICKKLHQTTILTDFLKILDWSSVMRASAGLGLQSLAWHYIFLSKFFLFRDTAVTPWWKKQDVSHPVSWQSVLSRRTGGSLFNAHSFPFPHFYICQQTKISSHQLVWRSAPWLSLKFFCFSIS